MGKLTEKVSKLIAKLESVKKLLEKHGICEDCGEMFSHDIDAPFASCNCKGGECYDFTPYMKLEEKIYHLKTDLLSNWKLLPVDPTEEMISAALWDQELKAKGQFDALSLKDPVKTYKRMMAAAPKFGETK